MASISQPIISTLWTSSGLFGLLDRTASAAQLHGQSKEAGGPRPLPGRRPMLAWDKKAKTEDEMWSLLMWRSWGSLIWRCVSFWRKEVNQTNAEAADPLNPRGRLREFNRRRRPQPHAHTHPHADTLQPETDQCGFKSTFPNRVTS